MLVRFKLEISAALGNMGVSTFQLMAGFQEKDVKGTGRHCQGSGHFGALFQLQDLDATAEFGFLGMSWL